MPDFDPPPFTRGRRDPTLAERMLNDQAEGDLDDYGEAAEVSYVGLAPGDIIIAKVAISGPTPEGLESWFTYGVQSHVTPEENEAMAADRVSTIVNQRVLDLADDMFERLQERLAQKRAARPRITSPVVTRYDE